MQLILVIGHKQQSQPLLIHSLFLYLFDGCNKKKNQRKVGLQLQGISLWVNSFSKFHSLVTSYMYETFLDCLYPHSPSYCKTFPGWLPDFPPILLLTSYPYLFLFYFMESIQHCPYPQGCRITTVIECLVLSICTVVQGHHGNTMFSVVYVHWGVESL